MSVKRREWPLIMPKKKPGVAYSKTPLTPVMTGKSRGVIKSLNGTPENYSPNEAMIHNVRCITSDKRKADVKHYSSVSKIDIS